jgi:hypothetical protein
MLEDAKLSRHFAAYQTLVKTSFSAANICLTLRTGISVK